MDISVIICTYNRANSLRTALADLRRQELAPGVEWEVLVVDNNSTDATRAVVEQSGPPVRYIFERRQGKSYALNTGIREAKGRTLLFTDDDVTFDPHWAASMCAALDDAGCIAAAGRIKPVWNDPAPPWLELDGQQAICHYDAGEMPRETNYAVGANAGYRREAFEKYGGFRDDLGPAGKSSAGYEDDEMGRRLTRNGEKIIYAPRAVVYHPVERHRLTKAYFRKWHYNIGRSMMRARIWPDETTLYAGIPRYVFRAVVENALLCPLTLNPKRRFRRECLALGAAGAILEGCRMMWKRR